MSSTLATSAGAARTPRLTPPAAPTRKATPRRRTVGQGASLVGRADRPVLRIVADDERMPVLTRIAPTVEPALPSVVEPVGGVETHRRVDLADFFAAEYDGDDVSVAIARPRPSSLRLTRRGRLVVFGAGLAAMLGLGFVAATGSLADDQPEPTRVVTVQPGQTLWDIAARGSDGGDVRATVAHLEAINHLDSPALQVGQHLRVPK
ncbi:MAG TPA: LysM peptidoglycan-binding domain-containing protein [Nocardioides sp.]|uniref:LysM peptidoglycan-binding domain-containing protein n=1 Tax=Nocardioides sp. TaxID=35761 RepID=UPI002F42DA26